MIFLVVMGMITNPIRRTNVGVRRDLLRNIPIGTSLEDAINIAEKNNRWTIRVVRERFGVVLEEHLTPSRAPFSTDQISNAIGKKSIEIHLGHYSMILRVDVTAFLAFDENNELIEIFILREYDGL